MREEVDAIIHEAQRRIYYNIPKIIKSFEEIKDETNPYIKRANLETILDVVFLITPTEYGRKQS